MKLTPALLTTIMLLVVGSLVAAFVTKRMLAREEVITAQQPITIPMALTDLRPGTVITEAHIGSGTVQPGELNREVLRTSRVVVDRVVKNPITRAEPIRTSDLYAPGERPPLEVASGMRAVSVALGDEAALVNGLMTPGQFADVHFTPSSDVGDRGGMVMTLFEGVKLLAVNSDQSSASTSGSGLHSVTLELTPEQANIILLASNRGRINLTYSPNGPGTGGVAVADADRAFLDEILGLARPSRPFVTEVYSGTDRRANRFEEGRLLSSRTVRGSQSSLAE